MNEKHWTEEELIAHLYGIGPTDRHAHNCALCASKLSSMQNARLAVEAAHDPNSEANSDFLNAQRRKIYRRISQPLGYGLVWRVAPVLAASLVLSGGLFLYDQQTPQSTPTMVKVSDTQLVEDVGGLAMNPEPAPVAPIRALFEE